MRIAFGTVSFIVKKIIPTEKDLGVYNYLEIEDINREIERPFEFPNKKRRYAIKNQKDFEKIPGNNIGYWLSENMLSIFSRNKLLENIGDGKVGLQTGSNERFIRIWSEVSKNDYYLNAESLIESKQTNCKWFPYNKAGQLRKWYGNQDYLVNWENDGFEIKNFRGSNGKIRSAVRNPDFYFKESISWGLITSAGSSFRLYPNGFIYDVGGMSYFPFEEINKYNLLGSLNSKLISQINNLLNPTINLQIGDVIRLPYLDVKSKNIETNVINSVSISRQEWNSRETSWDFKENELIRLNGQDLEEAIDLYKTYWTKKFIQLHQNEEELNKQFIEIYGLEEDLDPNVSLEDITILRGELDQKKLKELSQFYKSGWTLNNGKWELLQPTDYPDLPFNEKELVQQFISYGVGCMFGRYSLDKPGLILANQGETIQDYLDRVGKNEDEMRFAPDKSNIIPVLDSEWFGDDIVTQFRAFVKAVWGEQDLQRNLEYIESTLGKSLRNYFYRDFYADHVKRYKKRPIYWLFSSPEGSFQALVYLHRYTPQTMSHILNDYLRPYIDKLENRVEHLNHLITEGSDREKIQAAKEIVKVENIISDLRKFDREVFYPMAMDRISIDLDDGVLVNYNKFGTTLKTIPGLNDKKAKDKVKKFDWIDTSEIR